MESKTRVEHNNFYVNHAEEIGTLLTDEKFYSQVGDIDTIEIYWENYQKLEDNLKGYAYQKCLVEEKGGNWIEKTMGKE